MGYCRGPVASRARELVWWGLVLLLCSFILAACGSRGGTDEAGSRGSVASAEDADVGQAIQSPSLSLELTGLPEKTNVVGTDTAVGTETRQAEIGVFIIVPLKLTNLGDEAELVDKHTLVLRDGQGREFPPAGPGVQLAHSLERQTELLVDNVLQVGQSKDGFVVFDVPEGAEGFTLGLTAAEGALALGF